MKAYNFIFKKSSKKTKKTFRLIIIKLIDKINSNKIINILKKFKYFYNDINYLNLKI